MSVYLTGYISLDFTTETRDKNQPAAQKWCVDRDLLKSSISQGMPSLRSGGSADMLNNNIIPLLKISDEVRHRGAPNFDLETC
jgi:hypothetical protein